jgi:putative ABC transport system substrate-binding protein
VRDILPHIAAGMIPFGTGQMAIDIGRRRFISALGGAAAALPLVARAQSEKTFRIGLFTRYSDASVSAQIDAFRQGLRDLGWIEGKSITIEYRNAEGQADRLPALAAELVGLNVDVIVTVDTPPTQAAKRATGTIPIVIAVSADPVGIFGGNSFRVGRSLQRAASSVIAE